MKKIGFDHKLYLKMQAEKIQERISQFEDKLYLEFGGKLFDDHHASRVLPGFQPDSKISMLKELKDQAEIILVISASDIEENKKRRDLGISYETDALRLIDAFRSFGLLVESIALTRFAGQPSAKKFQRHLQSLGLHVYRHYSIEGYPHKIHRIVSDEGYGKNEYIKTTRPLVVVTAPGPGSGKMAVCLSQLYHEHKRGIRAGYAKYETFPIWNLPLSHPVNLAYEAATADLNDVNMIDPYHLDAYGKSAVNYNRDVEIFPVLQATFERILGCCPYKSPTDMGVNMAGYCIVDDEVVCEAAKNEIIRRYFHAMCRQYRSGSDGSEVYRIELIMKKLHICRTDLPTVPAALTAAKSTKEPAAAMELPDGRIITGKTTALMGASSALLLNALKEIGGIPDEVQLISPHIIEPVQNLKVRYLGNQNPRLHTDEVLISLSICAAADSNARLAMEQIPKLRGLNVHSSVILSEVDENTFRRLGVHLTTEPRYQTQNLYHK